MTHFTHPEGAGKRGQGGRAAFQTEQQRNTDCCPAANALKSVPAGFQEYHFSAMISAMKTTIDSAGRVVVPKALRDALQLRPGQPLDVRATDGRLEIEPAPTPVRLVKRGRGVVAVPETPLPRLTSDEVRETMERIRR